MTMPIQPFKKSQPGLQNVTGKFIIPAPFAPGGLISADSGARPLKVGTEVNIVCSTNEIAITLAVDLSDWGVNVGDAVNLSNSNMNGQYKITSITSLGVGGVIKCPAPSSGLTIISGWLYFSNFAGPFWQKIVGDGTNFLKTVTANKFIGIMSATLNNTVQVCRVAKVVSDTELWVYRGFLGAMTDETYLVIGGSIRGVAIKCGGAGTINGESVSSGDVLNFYKDSGLDPVYGDAGSNTFKILIER